METPAKSPGDSNDMDKSNGKSRGTETKDSDGKRGNGTSYQDGSSPPRMGSLYSPGMKRKKNNFRVNKMPRSMKKKMSPSKKRTTMRKMSPSKKRTTKRNKTEMMEEEPGMVSTRARVGRTTGAKVGVMGVETGASTRMGSPKRGKGKKMSVKSKKGKKMSPRKMSRKRKTTKKRMNDPSDQGLNPDAPSFKPNARTDSRFFNKDGTRKF